GLAAQNGAVVDAGQVSGSSAYYGNITGLGVSTGGNTFLGYTAAYVGGSDPAVVPQAVRDLNSGGVYAGAGPQLGRYDLPAQANNFGAGTALRDIENLIDHDFDNAGLGFVSHGTATAPASLVGGAGAIAAYAADPGEGTTAAGQKSVIRHVQVVFSGFV